MQHSENKAKLTPAQKREYELLKKHGSIGVWSNQRRKVFQELVKKGYAQKDIHYHWFNINE